MTPVAPELIERAVAMYQSGLSIKAVAEALKVSRSAITRALRSREIEIIGISERNRRRYANTTDEYRKASAMRAQTARKGMRDKPESLAARAVTRQNRGHGVSENERAISAHLELIGINGTPQLACGPFNIDIGIATQRIAVEIFGGNFHGYGHHRKRTARRYAYLAEQGWRFVIVWVMADHYSAVADIAIAVAATIREHVVDKPAGSWWVLRGDGLLIRSGIGDFKRIAEPISLAKLPI